jgi:hypothetical protein
MSDHHASSHQGNHGGDVDHDIDKPAIVKVGVQLVVVTVISVALMWPLLKVFGKMEAKNDAPKVPMQAQRDAMAARPFPAPVLQPGPQHDMRDMRHAQDSKLASYGWVDGTKTAARVPIARAMQILAARNAGAVPATAAPAENAPAATATEPAAPAAAAPAAPGHGAGH